jgi:hypothetical protein
VRAGQRQMMKLLHAMGDVHPHALKAKLARAEPGHVRALEPPGSQAQSK